MIAAILAALPRLLLGLIFLVGAVDGFWLIFTGSRLIHPPTSEAGLAFETALKNAGFFWPLMKTVQLTGALCLLSNKAPALGLALLAPLLVVIVLFHFVLNPGGIPIAIILIVLSGILAFQYRRRFAALLGSGYRP